MCVYFLCILSPEYPELTPYQFASNTPIEAIDLDGLEALSSKEKNGEGIYSVGAIVENNEEASRYLGNGKWQKLYRGWAREGEFYSSKNYWIDLPHDYNRYTRDHVRDEDFYVYSLQDLRLRYKIFSNPSLKSYKRFIIKREKEGRAVPIHKREFVKQLAGKYNSTSSFLFLPHGGQVYFSTITPGGVAARGLIGVKSIGGNLRSLPRLRNFHKSATYGRILPPAKPTRLLNPAKNNGLRSRVFKPEAPINRGNDVIIPRYRPVKMLSPSKAPGMRSDWHRFLHQNSHRYKNIKGRGNWIKKAAKDYKGDN